MSARPEPFEADGLERLLQRAERDPAASEELDFLADLVAAAELQRTRLARAPAPAAAARPRARSWGLAVAALVLLSFALGAWLFLARGRGSARSLVAALEPPRYVAAELRSGEEPLERAFPRAMEPYARGEWAQAARALEELLAVRPDHGPARFYLAAALEQLGELERAEEHYLRATGASDALLADDARFRLALLWLARGEDERARAQLVELRDGDGELARNARELLDDLERR